jgi:hypothetical protein
VTDPLDPKQIDPDAIYTVDFDSGGEAVRELDEGTGEIVDFTRGPEVHDRMRMTGKQVLDFYDACERARATRRQQAVIHIVRDTEYAMESDSVPVETDDVVPPKEDE